MTFTSNNGGTPQDPPQSPRLASSSCRSSTCSASTSRISFENPNAPKSLAPTRQQPQINVQINVSVASSPTDFEVDVQARRQGRSAGRCCSPSNSPILAYSAPERPAGTHPAAGHDRVPAAPVPVRARDHRERFATAASRRCCSTRSISLRSISSGWRRRNRSSRAAIRAADLSGSPLAGRYSRQIAFSPSVATNAGCASRSVAVSRGGSGERTPRRRHRLARRSAMSHCTTSTSERGLPAADQLDIDFGQQLGVEQRAVLRAPRIVDPVTGHSSSSLLAARMPAPGQQQRIDHPLERTAHGRSARARR